MPCMRVTGARCSLYLTPAALPHLNLCANTPWNSTPMTCSSSLARWCSVDTWRRSAVARSDADCGRVGRACRMRLHGRADHAHMQAHFKACAAWCGIRCVCMPHLALLLLLLLQLILRRLARLGKAHPDRHKAGDHLRRRHGAGEAEGPHRGAAGRCGRGDGCRVTCLCWTGGMGQSRSTTDAPPDAAANASCVPHVCMRPLPAPHPRPLPTSTHQLRAVTMLVMRSGRRPSYSTSCAAASRIAASQNAR